MRNRNLTLNDAAVISGVAGFLLLVAGVSAIYWPAGLVVAGVFLLCWSAIVARAVARMPRPDVAAKPTQGAA
jgi:hypothetical protein